MDLEKGRDITRKAPSCACASLTDLGCNSQRKMEEAVNVRNIFTKRIYIRLEGDAFICTAQYGELFGRLTRYAIDLEESVVRRPRSGENLIHLHKPPNDAA
jgi:hypothetical protein